MRNQSPHKGLHSTSPIPTNSYVLFYPLGWTEGEESEYGWTRDYDESLDAYRVEFDDEGGLSDWIPAKDIIEVVEKGHMPY